MTATSDKAYPSSDEREPERRGNGTMICGDEG